MTHEQELLAIEKERLAMEKLRDKKASFRFYVGSVLIVVITSLVSFFITYAQNEQLQKRSLVNSEKQWVASQLLNIKPESFDEIIQVIDRLLAVELTRPVVSYLHREKSLAVASKKEFQVKENTEAMARVAATEQMELAREAQKIADDAMNKAHVESELKQAMEAAKKAQTQKIVAQRASAQARKAKQEKESYLSSRSLERHQRLKAIR